MLHAGHLPPRRPHHRDHDLLLFRPPARPGRAPVSPDPRRGPQGGVEPALGLQLRQHVADVVAHRLRRQAHLLGDLGVAPAVGQVLQDLVFPLGQLGEGRPGRPAWSVSSAAPTPPHRRTPSGRRPRRGSRRPVPGVGAGHDVAARPARMAAIRAELVGVLADDDDLHVGTAPGDVVDFVQQGQIDQQDVGTELDGRPQRARPVVGQRQQLDPGSVRPEPSALPRSTGRSRRPRRR